MVPPTETLDEIARLRLLCSESPDHAGLSNNLGCLLLAQSEVEEARQWLERATRLEPQTWEFHRNLAEAFLRLGLLDKALQSLRSAHDANPGEIDALLPLLDALLSHQEITAAEELLANFIGDQQTDNLGKVSIRNFLNAHRTSVELSATLLLIWGKLENQLGMPQAATEIIDRLLTRWPDHVDALREKGLSNAVKGELVEAMVYLTRVTQLAPDDWAAWNDGGACLRTMGQLSEARNWMQRATSNAPGQATLHANLALIDYELNDYETCDKHLKDAFAIDPQCAEALHTHAMLLAATGCHKEALRVDYQALAVKPDYPAARLGLALNLLTLGNLREGFAAYESRWVGSDRADKQKQPTIGRPQWHGQTMLPGACIAVLPEQGFGDQLQFARFVPQLLDHFHRVVWMVPVELLSLFQRSFASERLQVVANIDANQARLVDVELPLLSLPLLLKVDLPALPGPTRYLRPLEQQREYWLQRLEPIDALKVGVVWQGRPTLSKNALRNCPSSLFQTLVMQGVQLVSLQRDAELPIAANALDLVRECNDFADTAALITNLDLVITVDTALAHLTGGLGVPVWLLNRRGSEWRWMTGREDSPWYPTMRLFNQTEFNNWAPTIEQVKLELNLLQAQRSRQRLL